MPPDDETGNTQASPGYIPDTVPIRMEPEELTDIKFVGPATKAVLERAGVEPTDIAERRVSHAQLVNFGVNPGVAARIRREHSLSWSLEGGEDLDRRAEQVRGLQDGERAWVAESSTDWDAEDLSARQQRLRAETEDVEAAEAAWRETEWPNRDEAREEIDAEAAWREKSKPTPVTRIDGIGSTYADRLAEAGIQSVRSLASCDPERVAASLELSEAKVTEWRDAAKQLV